MKSLSIRSGVMTVCCFTVFGAVCTGAGEKASPVRFTVEPGHAWTPPFGLERVGRPMDAVVEVPGGDNPKGEYEVAGYRDGKEIGRQPVKFRGRFGRVALADWPKEAVLFLKQDGQARWVEMVRTNVVLASFEADAVARPDKPVHPVDYGAILVPDGWLLLAGGQKAEVEVAALSRSGDIPGAVINAWYESAPNQKVKARFALNENRKARAKTSLRGCSRELKQDTLHVAIANGTGKEIWRKDIRVMIVPEPPQVPRFGAVETKLRYDSAIPVNGKQPISFAEGWEPKLQDLVVFFPNGARFVCWRGSSYCPFWASRSNTGLCYEWAEILSGHTIPNVHDCVEPLQDKELRYGRVQIVESTPARVHVRWSYQSCDLDYKVGGSSAVEDYFFYPDGFGTRVLTLTANPGSKVETQEFIIFTPQSGYPLDYLTGTEFDLLWPEGKAVFRFPCRPGSDGQDDQWAKLKGQMPVSCIGCGSGRMIHWRPFNIARWVAGMICRDFLLSATAGLRPPRCTGAATGLSVAAILRAGRSATASMRRPDTTPPFIVARPNHSGP